MSLELASARDVLIAVLATMAITWSLQLQFIWRAFETVRKPRAIGLAILTLLMLGFVALAVPLATLALSAAGQNGFFDVLFWISIGLAGGFLVALLALYVVLTLVFLLRGHNPAA